MPMMGKDRWFQAHRSLMILAVLLTILGAIFAFVYTEGWHYSAEFIRFHLYNSLFSTLSFSLAVLLIILRAIFAFYTKQNNGRLESLKNSHNGQCPTRSRIIFPHTLFWRRDFISLCLFLLFLFISFSPLLYPLCHISHAYKKNTHTRAITFMFSDNPHPVLGLVVIILAIINPLMALIR